MRIMMTWTIWCSFNQSKIDGRSFWEAFLEWRTICTWSFLFSLPIICFLQWSFLFSDVDEALAATKERLICDVCGNVVGANICNSSILIYITERSDDDNIYIMMKFCLSVLTFYPNVTKIHSLKICLSRKINTFQLGSSLTPLYPSLISSTPLGPMRHSKSLYPQEGQFEPPNLIWAP